MGCVILASKGFSRMYLWSMWLLVWSVKNRSTRALEIFCQESTEISSEESSVGMYKMPALNECFAFFSCTGGVPVHTADRHAVHAPPIIPSE